MKKTYSLPLILSLIALPALSSCGNESGGITIHLTNCEDYIGEDAFSFEDEDGEVYDFDDVLTGFEQYYEAKTGVSVSVVYDTYDTNETMLSGLKTGKTEYDLICASDYTLQKMLSQGMLQTIDFSAVPNYGDYCPEYLRNTLSNIYSGEESLGDYAVGYMWGTLGVLYNPEKIVSERFSYSSEEEKEECIAEVKTDIATSWTSLWDSKYRNQMSIKDSMRDTYSVGIMKLYEDNFVNGTSTYLIDKGYTASDISEIFNLSDKETTTEVERLLLELKNNVYGFEVDSGKDDIVKGLIGMNLAWSGDAVYSMDLAEDPSETSNPQTLYYTIPETGGNIWFDGWVMPATCSGEEQKAALAFLDFICNPQVATASMEYIGYTPFIGGDEIRDLVRSWYDLRTEVIYQYDEEEDDYVYDEEGNMVPYEGMEDWTYLAPGEGSGYASWDEYFASLVEEGEYDSVDKVDLSYMFGGLEEENSGVFYTAEIEHLTDEDGNEITVGRQFYTQYPSQEMINKSNEIGALCIMNDYGDNNENVLKMWENVKSNNLPLAGVIVFAVILVAAAVAIIVSFSLKRYRHSIRVKRRKEELALKAHK